MNLKCLFGKHEWEDDRLPFTDEKLRKCTRCSKMEILTPKGWIPFEGAVALIGLTFALNNMGRAYNLEDVSIHE